MGCLIFILIFIIAGILISIFDWLEGMPLLITSFAIVCGIFYGVSKLFDNSTKEREKKLNQKLEDGTIGELEKAEITLINRRREAKKFMQFINYEGGHDTYSKSTKGELLLIDNGIEFYDKFRRLAFTISSDKIKNIRYDTSENISLGKMLMFGLGSFAMKDKTYYLLIDYVSDKGIDNQLVFETGETKNQDFVNELNVLRNEFAKV